jgi:hypothetical protein
MSSIGNVATATTQLRGGDPVTIQIPQVNRLVLDVSSDVNDGETLIIGCLPSGDKREYIYYLLTANNVSEAVASPSRDAER